MLENGLTKSTSSQNYVRFRELLVRARREAGMTQMELAGRLDRPQSFVSKYECGERRLDVVEFLHVAESLGVDALKLIRALQEHEDWSESADRM